MSSLLCVRGALVSLGVWGLACAMGLLAFASPAAAETIYGFQAITSNSTADVATGQTQLFVGISDVGNNQVAFRFFNVGPKASSITDVYFDDGSLMGISTLQDADDKYNGLFGNAGVDFTKGSASPGDLPAGNSIDPKFNVSQGFLADSDNNSESNQGTQQNGVNPGEQLLVVFNLINGKTFADTISMLNAGLNLQAGDDPDEPDTLRIGIHVQGFGDGKSESFVNGGPVTTSVPLPGVALAGIALFGCLGGLRQRKLAS
jgi:hypothetical protein